MEAAAASDLTEDTRVAFVELFSSHEAYVLRALRRLGVREADLEDLGHEVFLIVHRKLADLDVDRPVRPWLFAFCFRVAANYRRGARRAGVSTAFDEVEDDSPSTEARLEKEDDRRLVLAALEVLDLDRRAVFVMHCLDEIPIPEVSRALSIPLGTAYTRLRAAKSAFVDEVRRLQHERSDP